MFDSTSVPSVPQRERRTESALLEIRPAMRRDAPFLAWAILSASRGHLARGWFDIALGRPETDILRFLTRLTITKTPSRWHYTNFFVAEIDSHLVATVCAFRADQSYLVSKAAVSEAADSLGIPSDEHHLIWHRGAYLLACSVHPDDEAWVLESLATLPAFRRRGCAASLVNRALEKGRTMGLREAEITLYIGNERAQSAYERLGFVFSKDSCDGEFHAISGSPGLRRLTCSL